jgi:hypothetical protein
MLGRRVSDNPHQWGDYNTRRLVAAVIRQAVTDLKGPRFGAALNALTWLLWDGGLWAEELEIDQEALIDRVFVIARDGPLGMTEAERKKRNQQARGLTLHFAEEAEND